MGATMAVWSCRLVSASAGTGATGPERTAQKERAVVPIFVCDELLRRGGGASVVRDGRHGSVRGARIGIAHKVEIDEFDR